MIVGQLVKEPAEEITVGIDFTTDLVTLETVDSAVVSSRNAASLITSSSTFLSPASHDIQTPVVMKRCRGGAHGETHLVQMTATTNFGNVYEHEVEVLVAEN